MSPSRHPALAGAQHEVRGRAVRALPARAAAGLPRRPGGRLRRSPRHCSPSGSCDEPTDPGRLEVRLLRRLPADPARLRGRAARHRRRGRIAHFLEASSAVLPGPYDVSLVEGSITTAADAERIQQVRAQSRVLITIGACATAGGIQALRNFGDVERVPRRSSTPARSTSTRWPPRPRSPRTCRSTSSCAGARSTSANCSRSSRPTSSAASPTSRTPASAPNASAPG